jgi:hypothetical protein
VAAATQMQWLEGVLANSSADYLIVGGHVNNIIIVFLIFKRIARYCTLLDRAIAPCEGICCHLETPSSESSIPIMGETLTGLGVL